MTRTFTTFVAPVVVGLAFIAVENQTSLNNYADQMVPKSCLLSEAALANCKFGPGF